MREKATTAMVGFGTSEITRYSDRGMTAFALEAALAAIADAGLTREDVDGYIGAPWATNQGAVHAHGADEICYRPFLKALGIEHLRYGADLYKGFPTDMVVAAAHALLAGECRYVLGVRALYNLKGVDYATSASRQAWGDDQFVQPYGLGTVGARFATRIRRYMERWGVSRHDLFEVIALSRRNAARNPVAIWRNRQISLDEYLDAPMVASPHCLFDCDIPVCGAMAFVMSRSSDVPSAAAPAFLKGWSGHQRPWDVFDDSGVSAQDVDQCQLYDGFSSMVYEWLEGFRWCEEGQAWKFIRDGHADVDGCLPVNTFGGSLGEGRLHGMGHVREGYLQTAGKAGERQLSASDHCLVQVGPYDSSSFVLLCREP